MCITAESPVNSETLFITGRLVFFRLFDIKYFLGKFE